MCKNMKTISKILTLYISLLFLGCSENDKPTNESLIEEAYEYFFNRTLLLNIKLGNSVSFYIKDGSYSDFLFRKYMGGKYGLEYYSAEDVSQINNNQIVIEKIYVIKKNEDEASVSIVSEQLGGEFCVILIPYKEKWVPVDHFFGPTYGRM